MKYEINNKLIGDLVAKILGNSKEAEPTAKPDRKLPDNYVSASWQELLDEIKYDAEGKLPVEDNALADFSDGETAYFWCSKKPVGIVTKDGKVVEIAPNAYDRITTSVARKWALERDWIPEYKYSLEDNKSVVGLALLECLADGTPREKYIKTFFKSLDLANNADKPNYRKTVEPDETVNDAERAMYALLFTGDTNQLHPIPDEKGNIMPLSDGTAIEDFKLSELKSFEKITTLFAKVHEAHKEASLETWKSALCHALRVPTKEAIDFIWGDKANGKKKFHRAEVAYSRMVIQVSGWILEEVEKLDEKGFEKWKEVAKRNLAINKANKHWKLVKEFSLCEVTDELEDTVRSNIVANPEKADEFICAIILHANETAGTNFSIDDDEANELERARLALANIATVATNATSTELFTEEDMPF